MGALWCGAAPWVNTSLLPGHVEQAGRGSHGASMCIFSFLLLLPRFHLFITSVLEKLREKFYFHMLTRAL